MKPYEVFCPRCKKIFFGDSNNNLYADCPGCGWRKYMENE